jgi:uncharacterized membrane protein YfcA
MVFLVIVGAVAVLAGGIASVAGFGIGSLLTPLFALQVGTKVAVAAVAIPHAVATALRFWMLRAHIDRRVLWSFGVTSAAGGLAGALLHNYATSPLLAMVFGVLLVFAGLTGLTGLADRMRFGGLAGWIAGGISGLLGGLVGNQGGIRSAAMLGFDVPKEAFVATATAIGLAVDAARLPVYLATQAEAIGRLWELVAVATAGALLGTLVGARLLRRVPEPIFRRVVSAVLLALGIATLIRGGR